MWTDNIKEWTKISYNECISGTISRTMEIHNSRPVDYRRHIMMNDDDNIQHNIFIATVVWYISD